MGTWPGVKALTGFRLILSFSYITNNNSIANIANQPVSAGLFYNI